MVQDGALKKLRQSADRRRRLCQFFGRHAKIGKTVRWGGVRRDRVPAFNVFNMRDTAATDENGIIR